MYSNASTPRFQEDNLMDFIYVVIVIALIGIGFVSMFTTAREKGIGVLIFQIIAIVVLIALGL